MTEWMIGVLLIIIGLAAAFLLRSAYERNCLTTTEYTVRSTKLPKEFDGLKLAFLTDLHHKEFGEDNERLLAEIEKAAPDMVLVGGDLMVAKGQEDCSLEISLRLLSALAKRYPVYYGYGNHELRLKTLPIYRERYQDYLGKLREMGIRVLDDTGVSFHGEKGSLTLTGLTVPKAAYPKLKKEPLSENLIVDKVGRVPETDMRILLAHNPLYREEYAAWGADLTLSGHYHGGTVILPVIGAVMSPDLHLFPKVYRGRYEQAGKTLIVSGGLGTHSVNIRFGNKPELVVVKLLSEEK